MHGGAYCINSPRVYTTLAGHLALATGATVILPRYRLAPEHPYPAGLDDVLAAYRAVASRAPPGSIMAGDSAGGRDVALRGDRPARRGRGGVQRGCS